MSGLEIERKFLVRKDRDWKRLASSCSHIQQGYFAALNTVRVRIRDDKGYLTIKGPSSNGGLSYQNCPYMRGDNQSPAASISRAVCPYTGSSGSIRGKAPKKGSKKIAAKRMIPNP